MPWYAKIWHISNKFKRCLTHFASSTKDSVMNILYKQWFGIFILIIIFDFSLKAEEWFTAQFYLSYLPFQYLSIYSFPFISFSKEKCLRMFQAVENLCKYSLRVNIETCLSILTMTHTEVTRCPFCPNYSDRAC